MKTKCRIEKKGALNARGADYVIDRNRGKKSLSQADRLQQIFQAIDKKKKEMNTFRIGRLVRNYIIRIIFKH